MSPLRSIGLTLACTLAACGGNPPAPQAGGSSTSTSTTPTPAQADGPATRGPDKPGAPIDLAMEARPAAGTADVDRFVVRLTATPRRDLDSVALSIDGRPSQAVAATAGAIGDVTATIDVARGEGKVVIGTAVVVVDGKRMGAATEIRVGAPAADQPAGTIIHLPDGTPVQEVRP